MVTETSAGSELAKAFFAHSCSWKGRTLMSEARLRPNPMQFNWLLDLADGGGSWGIREVK